MRKALLMLAMVLAASACLWSYGEAAEAELEPTDSGAPSAIVIFPVGETPNPRAAAMPPVAFNHVIHEKWMARTEKDCIVCHHTGDAVACTNCHTVQGSEKAHFVNLERAMHATEIRERKKHQTPSSCVSCHIRQTRQRECAGCHGHLVRNAREKDSWCNVCHKMTPAMTAQQLQAGIANKLPETQNEKLAAETALARAQTKYWTPLKAPYKINIDTLANLYKPCVFNHRHHVISLMENIGNNKLAGAFHTEQATICVTCHHNSPPSATPPKCSSCHSKTLDFLREARPNLMAAFHLECMSCHKDMKVARPRNTDCNTCHKLQPGANAPMGGNL
ncbi:MAG: cytochrome c3 family protein [Desulfovibrio sp.]|nr:cytochrome c3 family protein [Desulfovibrio sp.]